jgi:hypothetical protein
MDDPQEVVAWGPIDGEPPVGLDVRAEHPTMVDAFDKAAVSTPLHALPSRITPSHFSLICPLRLLTLLRAIDSRAHSDDDELLELEVLEENLEEVEVLEDMPPPPRPQGRRGSGASVRIRGGGVRQPLPRRLLQRGRNLPRVGLL